ncbi:hypothetical protein [Enterococcus casseliflavus]|uniref:hypothetical protein n=1 Tax=Enterococcus casseliflavus TaxID=37734 RepID=UPI000EB2E361|nr:hypothetical protein [Enterococcus casseliflavus]AYJ46542.1 hypothetical protein D8N35_16160 [Enterococcus casseliflavus]MBS5813763.1 hypothetical protein [Enterococcus casseliflavus]MCD4962117.1 hypothetical protein [Enterococcus casseliflavus]MDU3373590.1 hypothetical protein [Enterococcus casseliflavus]
MQSDKRITAMNKKEADRADPLCIILCILFIYFTIYHFLVLPVKAAEVSDTDSIQIEGTLAAILNSERNTKEPTVPLTEPLLEIVTELPDSELMIPFIELIYAVTPSAGQTLEKVYVNVNGEYDRHLYQRAIGEPKVTERTFGEARLFLSTDEQESRFELVAVDSSNKMTYYPIEHSFWLSENPEPPSPTIADVTTEDYYGKEVTFINNRLHLQLNHETYTQKNDEGFETMLDFVLDEFSYYDMELIAGPDRNDRVVIQLKQTSYEELDRLISDLNLFTRDVIANGRREEINLAAAEHLPKTEEPVNRSVEFKPEMLKIGWVPGLFFRRYQDNVILFKFHEESAFLNPESFPETYLSKALIKEKIDEAVATIGGVRLEENRPSYPYVEVGVAGNTPRNLVKKGQQLLTDYPKIFSEANLIIREIQKLHNVSDVYLPRWRVMSTFEERNYPNWAIINPNGTVSSLTSMGWHGVTVSMALVIGFGSIGFIVFIFELFACQRAERRKRNRQSGKN